MADLEAKQAAMRERLKDLGRQFLTRTEQEAVLLDGYLSRVRSGDTAAIVEIERLAHKICGTGASLGFPAVSEAAGRIEHLAHAGNPAHTDDIAAAIGALKEALRQPAAQ